MHIRLSNQTEKSFHRNGGQEHRKVIFNKDGIEVLQIGLSSLQPRVELFEYVFMYACMHSQNSMSRLHKFLLKEDRRIHCRQ